MIDLSREQAMSLQEAARLIPGRGGRPMNFSTVWRWVIKGAKNHAGRIVRLRAVRAGSKWITSQEALKEFFYELTPDFSDAPLKMRTPTARARASARAAGELEKLGI